VFSKKILDRPSKSLRVVLEVTETEIAGVAQEAPHVADPNGWLRHLESGIGPDCAERMGL
jgi:hypothetical protein